MAALRHVRGRTRGEAAIAARVALERFAVARRFPRDRWATVTALLNEDCGRAAPRRGLAGPLRTAISAASRNRGRRPTPRQRD